MSDLSCYVVFLLKPYYRNFGKRLIKSPKLYFYDVGLACTLLDISQDRYVKNHYLRGGLFETFVIAELLKTEYNRGQLPSIYFWRDQAGYEIDGIIERGPADIFAIEIKSAKTFNRQFFSNLRYLQKVTNLSSDKFLVVYAGDTDQTRSFGAVYSWKSIEKIILQEK
jgi:hypothetical protein